MAMASDPPLRLDDLPTWLLSQASVRAHRILTGSLADQGLRGHHARVLLELVGRDGLDQASLGRATDLDKGDVARVVDELEATSMVERRRDPADARRKIVALTSSGRARAIDVARTIQQVQDAVLAPLSPKEQAELVQLLRALQP